jgi:transcriptional regulator with XRE-family HTH domain
MERKKLLQEIGFRLQGLREQLALCREEMAGLCGLTSGGYAKNERGETFPGIDTLDRLSRNLDISMDWLIFNRGPVYYRQKELPEEKEATAESPPPEAAPTEILGLEEITPDVRELLEYMAKDHLLRHQILVYFFKYKKENPA